MFSAVSVFWGGKKKNTHGRFDKAQTGEFFSALVDAENWAELPTLLVSRQHPDFDVGFGQLLDGLRDSVLKLVLHRRRPQQLKVTRCRDAQVIS